MNCRSGSGSYPWTSSPLTRVKQFLLEAYFPCVERFRSQSQRSRSPRHDVHDKHIVGTGLQADEDVRQVAQLRRHALSRSTSFRRAHREVPHLSVDLLGDDVATNPGAALIQAASQGHSRSDIGGCRLCPGTTGRCRLSLQRKPAAPEMNDVRRCLPSAISVPGAARRIGR